MRVRIIAAVGTTAVLALAGAATAASADAATSFTCSYTIALMGKVDKVTVTPTPFVGYIARVALKSNPADVVAQPVSSATGSAGIRMGRKGIPATVTPAQITVTVQKTVCTAA